MSVFPEGFRWGCCGSPTQIEGETVNEWAGFVARDGSNPDQGPNHWRRYRFDFACMAEMGLNSYRLGMDWGRMQPGPGKPFSREAALRYLEMLAELRGHGIEPFMTLFHFACPKWLAADGGWLNADAPKLFADFAYRLALMADGEVKNWLTLNEPEYYAHMAYKEGAFPPGKSAAAPTLRKAIKHLQEGHALAYAAIKSIQPDAKVGIWEHFAPAELAKPAVKPPSKGKVAAKGKKAPASPFSWDESRFGDKGVLGGFLRHKGEPIADFLGISFHEPHPEGEADNQAEALLAECLAEISKQAGVPLYVSSHGGSVSDHNQGEQLLRQRLATIHNALADGVGALGYFHEAMIDGFEWCEGVAQRRGLVAVDYRDYSRRRDLRRLGEFYGRIARRNAV